MLSCDKILCVCVYACVCVWCVSFFPFPRYQVQYKAEQNMTIRFCSNPPLHRYITSYYIKMKSHACCSCTSCPDVYKVTYKFDIYTYMVFMCVFRKIYALISVFFHRYNKINSHLIYSTSVYRRDASQNVALSTLVTERRTITIVSLARGQF